MGDIVDELVGFRVGGYEGAQVGFRMGSCDSAFIGFTVGGGASIQTLSTQIKFPWQQLSIPKKFP